MKRDPSSIYVVPGPGPGARPERQPPPPDDSLPLRLHAVMRRELLRHTGLFGGGFPLKRTPSSETLRQWREFSFRVPGGTDPVNWIRQLFFALRHFGLESVGALPLRPSQLAGRKMQEAYEALQASGLERILQTRWEAQENAVRIRNVLHRRRGLSATEACEAVLGDRSLFLSPLLRLCLLTGAGYVSRTGSSRLELEAAEEYLLAPCAYDTFAAGRLPAGFVETAKDLYDRLLKAT